MRSMRVNSNSPLGVGTGRSNGHRPEFLVAAMGGGVGELFLANGEVSDGNTTMKYRGVEDDEEERGGGGGGGEHELDDGRAVVGVADGILLRDSGLGGRRARELVGGNSRRESEGEEGSASGDEEGHMDDDICDDNLEVDDDEDNISDDDLDVDDDDDICDDNHEVVDDDDICDDNQEEDELADDEDETDDDDDDDEEHVVAQETRNQQGVYFAPPQLGPSTSSSSSSTSQLSQQNVPGRMRVNHLGETRTNGSSGLQGSLDDHKQGRSFGGGAGDESATDAASAEDLLERMVAAIREAGVVLVRNGVSMFSCSIHDVILCFLGCWGVGSVFFHCCLGALLNSF